MNRELGLILENLKNNLPTGSGWSGWRLEFDFKHERIIGLADFACYNEGYLVGSAYFKVHFNIYDFRIFDLMFLGTNSQHLNRKHMLREYLEETIYESLGD